MKYQEWLQRETRKNNPSMGNPIYCPCCHKLIGYDKDYMFMVLTSPIVCSDCDEIVIYPNNGITFSTTSSNSFTI